MQSDLDDLPFKLDTWVDEKVPTKGVEIDMSDEKNPKFRVVEKMATRKTKYIYAPKVVFRCKDGEHVFRVLDTARYIFGCTKCPYSRKIYPTKYLVTPEGFIINKITGRRV